MSYPNTWIRYKAGGVVPADVKWFGSMGYDAMLVYIFGPLFGGVVAGLFQHINGWAQTSLEEAKKSYDE